MFKNFKSAILACVALSCLSFGAQAAKPEFISNIQYGTYYTDSQGVQQPYDNLYDSNGNNLMSGAVYIRAADISLVTKLGNSVKIDFNDGTTTTWTGVDTATGNYLWAKFSASSYPNPLNYNFFNADSGGGGMRRIGNAGVKSATCVVTATGGGSYTLNLVLKNGATPTAQAYAWSNCSDLTRAN